ncbi:MAG: ParB/RepB/Spo0J family partition protein [Acidobacteriota bacterium]
MPDRKPALGKGLSALIPEVPDALSAQPAALDVDVDLLEPNDYQPRTTLDLSRLEELARSIQVNGIIQPIVAERLHTPPGSPTRYRIIAGERRWRAAKRAGLHQVPIVVKEIADDEAKHRLELALVENIQREDLNPIEEAQAYERLVREFGHRHEDIAAAVGKDRSTIANMLRLLRLPAEVQAEVAGGRLTMGHARAIVALSSDLHQRRVARDVVTRALSVRETEAIVKKIAESDGAAATPREAAAKDVHTRAAEEQLRLSLGTRVDIVRRAKGGTVRIAFRNEDELQRIYEHLTDTRR